MKNNNQKQNKNDNENKNGNENKNEMKNKTKTLFIFGVFLCLPSKSFCIFVNSTWPRGAIDGQLFLDWPRSAILFMLTPRGLGVP